jgi:hypothetical protein
VALDLREDFDDFGHALGCQGVVFGGQIEGDGVNAFQAAALCSGSLKLGQGGGLGSRSARRASLVA